MRFDIETRIAAPPAVVFAFHESPGAFLKLVPPWERVQLVSGGDSVQEGAQTVFKLWLGGVPVKWVLEGTEYTFGSRFEQKLVKGPFSAWYHTHVFYDDDHGGTVLRDEIDYEFPLGPVGAWLFQSRVRRRLGRLFKFRHERTRKIAESGDFPGCADLVAAKKLLPIEAFKALRVDPSPTSQGVGQPGIRAGRARGA
jgi:hypothetical protein